MMKYCVQSFLSPTRLEHLVDELGDDGRDELGVRVGEEGDGGHQRATVEVHNVLKMRWLLNNLILNCMFSVAVFNSIEKNNICKVIVFFLRNSQLILKHFKYGFIAIR